MKKAILTGGTGFLGFGLLSELVANGIFVYVVVRENSKRLERLQGIERIKIIELSMERISMLPEYVEDADVFYHLAWEGERNDFSSQMKNINFTVEAMQVAQNLGVKQFIVTGSQAEYGICCEAIDENTPTNPNTAYGACKLASYHILKTLADKINMSLTWVRVFSVYGPDDNPNTLISYLFKCFNNGQIPQLTSGNQNWDFLYLDDAARALYLFGEKEKSGLYNLASGNCRRLKDFVIEARNLIKPGADVCFSENRDNVVVQLHANVDRLRKDLGWECRTDFNIGILKIKEYMGK